MESIARTDKEFVDILNKVSFRKSCVNLKWEWDWVRVTTLDFYGWMLRTSFVRPDIETGKVTRGFGRWEYISNPASESSIVKTCWLLAELIVRHELMEAFQYDGVQIFNPHHSVEELSIPRHIKDGKLILRPKKK